MMIDCMIVKLLVNNGKNENYTIQICTKLRERLHKTTNLLKKVRQLKFKNKI